MTESRLEIFPFIPFLHSTSFSESLLFVKHVLDSFLLFPFDTHWMMLTRIRKKTGTQNSLLNSFFFSSSRKGLMGGDVKTIAFGIVLSVILDYLCQMACVPSYHR